MVLKIKNEKNRILNILYKIGFYWDNIKRFESSQLFHLIFHKIRIRFSGIVSIRRRKPVPDYSLISKALFKERYNSIICIQNGNPVWDLPKTDDLRKIKYFGELKHQIRLNLNSLEKLWLVQHDDLEVTNNYCRFYLFAEAFAELQLSPADVVNIFNNFIVPDKPRSGQCWNGFNITIRIINWMKILYYYFDYLEERDWLMIQKSLFAHYTLLKKNIEKHIPGNHVLYQFFVLWLVSKLFPEWEKEKEWNSSIITEINKQFLPGGLHFELGYHYHIQTTLVILYWMLINRSMGISIPADIAESINRSVQIAEKFLLPDGTIPMTGDNCYCFFHQRLNEDILNIKILTSKGDSSLNSSEEGTLNISDRYLISEFAGSKLIMDVGELGLGSNPGHGHSDLLSIIFFQRAPVFIDPGTKRYTSIEEDLILKKSASHNTLTINSHSQAELGSFFRWAYLPDNIDFDLEEREKEHILCGAYSGFKKSGHYLHNRKIIHKNDFLEIEDRVSGKPKTNMQLNFILYPGISAEQESERIILKNKKFEWILKFSSEEKYLIKLLPFKVYSHYNEGENSVRINLFFNDPGLPFNFKTILVPA